MSKPENESGAAVLQKLDEQLNKYRFMDANLQQKKKRCDVQVQVVFLFLVQLSPKLDAGGRVFIAIVPLFIIQAIQHLNPESLRFYILL